MKITVCTPDRYFLKQVINMGGSVSNALVTILNHDVTRDRSTTRPEEKLAAWSETHLASLAKAANTKSYESADPLVAKFSPSPPQAESGWYLECSFM